MSMRLLSTELSATTEAKDCAKIYRSHKRLAMPPFTTLVRRQSDVVLKLGESL